MWGRGWGWFDGGGGGDCEVSPDGERVSVWRCIFGEKMDPGSPHEGGEEADRYTLSSGGAELLRRGARAGVLAGLPPSRRVT